MKTNPYSILGIPDFSSDDAIHAAYIGKKAEFDKISKLNAKQTELLDQLLDAYNLLNSPLSKESIDSELREAHFFQENTDTPTMSVSEAQDQQAYEEKILSREKNINVQAQTSTGMSPLKLMVLGTGLLFGVTYAYNLLFKSAPPPPPPVEAVQENLPAAPTPIALLNSDVNSTVDLVRYPDKSAFDTSLIYAPNGAVFPQTASVLGSLPVTGDGLNTIVVQNPRETAIFGRLVTKQSQASPARVLRYFYIPSKETLYLFNISAGQHQLQILTLNEPTAYVSPIFSLALGVSSEVTRVADWNYPYPAAELF